MKTFFPTLASKGYTTKTGKIVIEPNFGNTEDFRDGLAYVTDAETGPPFLH